ncbi:MAG: VCBS repeat-containing protein, partial [Sinomicrobium sp.]|nr:VCBS repeat-containing protein [Sinomicrobium sp.]
NRQKLIPYQISDRGPATAVGDLNGDGKTDIFFGGSKRKPAAIFIQSDSAYTEKYSAAIASDSIKEDVAAAIADFNNDGKNDLFVGSGGGDFYNKMKPLLDSYYLQRDSVFIPETLPEYFENASVVRSNDMDNDGDPDLFVGSHAVSNDFGKIPTSYLLKNDGGRFSAVPNEAVQQAGMITDAVWDDFDNDGVKDLIVVGEWMPPRFFKNTNGTLTEAAVTAEKLNGLWQSILPFDIDSDGDTDYLLGNWGTNTKFSAAATAPMKMYYADFDANGSTETVVCTQRNGNYYPLAGLDELAGQMVSLRKKFTAYKDFAGKTVAEIFGKDALDKAALLEVHVLQSGYLKNNNGRFSFVPFQNELQTAPITAFVAYDFDKDGRDEALAAGNYFGVTPFHGRFDAFPGALIKNEKTVILGNRLGLDFAGKAIRHLNIITLKGDPYLLATLNNDKAQVYQLIK